MQHAYAPRLPFLQKLPPRVFVLLTAFVLNHSKEYTAALLTSWFEFWLEASLLPVVKRQPVVVAAGAFLAVMGHFFRVGAMWTAGSNFNHEIMQRVSERFDPGSGGWGVTSIVGDPCLEKKLSICVCVCC